MWRDYEGAGAVYHLFSTALHRGIGKENLRHHHRWHSVEFIQTRLVLLDFILANPEYDYLETEQQKVRYFCEQLEVPKRSLPAKAYEDRSGSQPTLRYFVDKYPLFLDSEDASSPAVVTLSYVDPGQASLQGFRTHLKAYDSLLRRLGDFRFLYISNSPANFLRAEKCFSSLVQVPVQTSVSTDALRYFRLRNAWERKRYGTLSNDDIEWLNEATQRFHGEQFEGLYRAWAAGGLSESTLRLEFEQVNPHRKVMFGTYLVNGGRFGGGP